ncbi:hypothetical protein CGT68_18310 [Vibrio cholerae]|uniref:hypothetical protein n=1 Tax=Vibrio TaxID=662 RepID=UPI000BA8F30F|nr:hypothetical protein [Vibrio cholerae]PAS36808.1 hypothetical protein CGT69_18460 [Vibrio cholerae]PAS39611.1 hypothetical protein CGT68_18310 [Vibrio cholerae]
MTKVTKKTNKPNASSSSKSKIQVEVREQVDTLFSKQRNLVIQLRSKSVKVQVKSAGSNPALDWL